MARSDKRTEPSWRGHSSYGPRPPFADRFEAQNCIAAWTSLPVGVVTLAERHGGRHVTPDMFEAMVADVTKMLHPFEREHGFVKRLAGRSVHLLGTSGTVTTVAGIQLKLPRYDRNRVDGCWLDVAGVNAVTADLLRALTRSAWLSHASDRIAPTWCWPGAPSWTRCCGCGRAGACASPIGACVKAS